MVDKFEVNYCLKNAKDNHNDKSIHKNNMDYHHQHINSKCNNVGGIKLMKRLRSLVMKKLKGMTVINRLIAVLLLCAFLLQLSTLMTQQRVFIFRTASGPQVVAPPSPRIYESNGFLMVSSNGGLNQMRAGICDMVAIARYLNATLIVPELDKTSFWNDHSEFGDIFDMEHFITSLRDQVTILKELPKQHATPFSMPPVSWSNLTFYDKVVGVYINLSNP